jgi:CubicO group peptidase (beta-lactamase class C family)
VRGDAVKELKNSRFASWLSFILAGLVAAACGNTVPQRPVPPPEELLPALDAYVESAMPAWRVPGLALAIVKDGELVHVRGFGVRELGKPGPVDADTVFAIASMTKPFTAAAVGLLVGDGTLGWDDRVVDRLPGFALNDPVATADLRVRDLLSHRNGYDTWAGDLVWINARVDGPEALRRFQSIPPSWSLRYRFGYSNLMFLAAGQVIEAVSGKPWAAFVRERLLEPLGMTRTAVSAAERDAMDNVASPHMEVEGDIVVLPQFAMEQTAPAGAISSSAADLARWMRMQLENGTVDGATIVPAEVLTETRTAHTPIPVSEADWEWNPYTRLTSCGLGWFLSDYRGRLVVSHDGGVPGSFSVMMLVPEERLGVVVLCNAETLLTYAVAFQVLDAFLGAPETDWSGNLQRALAEATAAAETAAEGGEGAEQTPPTPPPLPLADFAGDYANGALGPAQVREADGALTLALADHPGLECPLAPKDGPAFECTWADPIFAVSDITFDIEDGRAVRLRFRVRPEFVDPLEYAFERTLP